MLTLLLTLVFANKLPYNLQLLKNVTSLNYWNTFVYSNQNIRNVDFLGLLFSRCYFE